MKLFAAFLLCTVLCYPLASISFKIKVFQEDSIYIHKRKQLDKAYKNESPQIIALKHYELGEYYQNALLYSEAIEQYYKALRIVEERDILWVNLTNTIASIYLTQKNFEKAKEYLNKSVIVSKKINYQKGLGVAESLKGSCFEKEGKYLKALQHQEKSANIFESLGDKRQIAIVNENIGSIYEDLNQFDKALNFFKKSNAYYKDNQSKEQISVLNNIGDIFRKTDKYEEAVNFTTQALNLAKTYQDLDEQKSAYKDLSETYEMIKNFESAYHYFQKYDEIENEVIILKNLKQFNTLQTIYETREKEAQIKLLTKQNEINHANQNLLIGGTIALALLLSLLYFNLQRKRRDKNKVQAFEQKLLKTELDKKAIIEKKLNDEIHLKTVSLTKYSLNIAQKNKLIAELSKTLTNIASRPKMQANQKIKTLAKELDKNLNHSEEWDEFMSYFKDINPNFFNQLSAKAFDKLSTTEYRLSMLLHLKMSSKEIASILRITPDSVRVARYRLRKKLPIESGVKLVQFLQDFK